MPSNTLDYIKLKNSNNTLLKRFRVIQGSLKAEIQGAQNNQRTTTGALDTSEGARWRLFTLTLKAYETDPITETFGDGSSYGSLANLRTFAAYNNPVGAPSNALTFEENYDSNGDGTGDSHTVRMRVGFVPDPVTPYLHGSNAFAYVSVVFEEIAAIA